MIFLTIFTLGFQPVVWSKDPPDAEDRNAVVTVETDIPLYLYDKTTDLTYPAKVSLREWRQMATTSLVISTDYLTKFMLSITTWLLSKKSAASFFKVSGYIEAIEKNHELLYLSRELCNLIRIYITDANRYYALEEDSHIEKVYLKNIVFVTEDQEGKTHLTNILINFEKENGVTVSFDMMDKSFTHLKSFNYYLLRNLERSPLVYQPNDTNSDAISVFLMGKASDSTYWVGILGEYYELLTDLKAKDLTLYEVHTSDLALLSERKAESFRPTIANTSVLYPNLSTYQSLQKSLHQKKKKGINLRHTNQKSISDALESHFSQDFNYPHRRFYSGCVSDFLLDMSESLETMTQF